MWQDIAWSSKRRAINDHFKLLLFLKNHIKNCPILGSCWWSCSLFQPCTGVQSCPDVLWQLCWSCLWWWWRGWNGQPHHALLVWLSKHVKNSACVIVKGYKKLAKSIKHGIMAAQWNAALVFCYGFNTCPHDAGVLVLKAALDVLLIWGYGCYLTAGISHKHTRRAITPMSVPYYFSSPALTTTQRKCSYLLTFTRYYSIST